jgi:hypothetical protein
MLSLSLRHLGIVGIVDLLNQKAKAPDPGAPHDASRGSAVETERCDRWIEQVDEKDFFSAPF